MMRTPLLLALLGLSSLSRSSAGSIAFPINATLVACPTDLSTPTQLASFSGGSLLVSPTSQEGDLCILSRVNRNDTSKKVYIPMARSYDGNDWHRVEGRYVSFVAAQCGEAAIDGVGFSAGDYLCEIAVPQLDSGNLGYFLTKWSEIMSLENSIATSGQKALALWVKNQQSLSPTSHRAFFRERLNPRAVESYIYGIPGPKACEKNARFRRFAFTYKDKELSRGFSGMWAGSSGLPFTPMEVETLPINGVNYYAVKFGGEIRTILSNPLTYKDSNNLNVTLSDGNYTICHAVEFAGDKFGDATYTDARFQVLVGDLCTSSYTNAGGVYDGKGDGSTSARVGLTLVRIYDKNACDAKCADVTKVKVIEGGNPEVMIPDAFNKTSLSWIDLSTLDTNSEIININTERTHGSSWLLQKDLSTCTDQNGVEFPNPARLAYTDYFSFGHGKYNLDKPIFAKLPGNKWSLHDFRTQFKGNTLENPLDDGGGATVKAAARSGDNDDGNPDTDLVVRCSNVQRNVFNEDQCRISYHPDACQSVPLRGAVVDPANVVEPVWKYLPSYAGPDNGGVVVCGSENEVAPIPTEDDHFDVTNRKVHSGSTDYMGQKLTVWFEVVLAAQDQLCQRLAFGLNKIFATSTNSNSDSINSETNIGVYDNFVTSCFSTYREVMKKVSFNQEMSEQLTFATNKAVATDWHRSRKLAWPDENYARENLQLHSIGLLKLNDDGTPVLDRFEKRVANYEQKHIFSAAKIWTSFGPSVRRGNYEDLDWSGTSYLDPLVLKDVSERDWFPKISSDGGYIGDKYPLCADLPERHFLRKGATFRLLGGSSTPLWHNDHVDWEGNPEVQRMSLYPGSQLYNKLCNPTNASPPSSTLLSGTGVAQYDATFTAPFCQGSSNRCDSGTLLLGRASEENAPNTIDGCSDGKDNNVTYADSVSRINVTSINGDDLRGGFDAKIQATVISRSRKDRVDFYFASDASSPVWQFITTVNPLETVPPREMEVTLPYTRFPDITYTLPKCVAASGCKQAVRVVSRSSRDPSNPTGAPRTRGDAYMKPDSKCANAPYDDVDDIVFEVLPSPRPKDTCSLQTLVTLDTNLECQGRECVVSTVRVVEVIAGVYYEYLHLPCVHLPFYDDAAKVFAGPGYQLAMCADKRLPSARSTCCGSYPWRDPVIDDWGDVLLEYRGERLTYAGNQARCADWRRTECDPTRIGPFTLWAGHCTYRQSCIEVRHSSVVLTNTAWHWTTAGCRIQVKINPDGLIAILHNPQDTRIVYGSETNPRYPEVQGHVNENTTVSYFDVQWDTSNVAVGKLEYPHVTDNGCDGGRVSGDFCVCNTTVNTHAVYDSIPTRDAILADLFIGAFDPTVMFATNEYIALIETAIDDGVSVYKKSGYSDYSEHTIFRIKDKSSDSFMFLKNVHSSVSVCDGAFFFRNSPTFFDIVDPQLVSAYHEIDAYLDYVDRHENTPPFVCQTLSKHFGYSNPSPQHVLGCSNAYKSGVFTWSNPADSSDTISFGGGKRGDMQAVSASILLSNDALSATLDSDPTFGGLKEPLHKLMQIMRSLEFNRSLTHRRTETFVSVSAQDLLGQTPYGIPDQFSFFSPDYSPPGAHIESSLVSPESELLNMKYVIASQNAFYSLIQHGLTICWGGIGGKGPCYDYPDSAGFLDFVPEGATSSSSVVVSQLSTLLTADRLDDASQNVIESAYSATLASKGEAAALKVAQALLVSSPVFHATNNAMPQIEERASTPSTAKDENEPYKAIIHLNLFGGMDSMNLLVPHPDSCPSLYQEYRTKRGPDLYLTIDELIKIDASTSDQPCASFGINKNLGQGFADLYNAGEVVFFANIGHLQKPVTANNFLAETKTQLFSHYTMKEESFKVDAFQQRDNTGILGRMTDILGNSMSTSRISIDRSSNILVGDPTIGLKVDVMGSRGPDRFYGRDIYGVKQLVNTLNNVTTEASSIHADLWSQSLIDSKEKSDNYLTMLQNASYSRLIPGFGLGMQFQMVLRLIKLREARGVNRDTFAVSDAGYDTHFDLKSLLNAKFVEMGAVLKAFRDELVDLGLWDSITIVVSSEMGRTTTPNTSGGTDHGWGGHHIVMGGNLNGGKILGHHPDNYNSKWMYNTGRGVWIPTTPNEAMWFGISQWFGLESDVALNYALPNMNNFGCRLYSETDIYRDGTGEVPGCGGDIMTFSQVFFLSEPRLLNPDEQKSFCAKVYNAISGVSIRCVILDQIIAVRDTTVSQRGLTALGYTLDVTYEISSDSSGVSTTIADVVNSNDFKTAATSAIQMSVAIESAQVVTTPTQSPSSSPSISPSKSPSRSPSTTRSPTEIPTRSPSLSPANPTASPTTSPSKSSSEGPGTSSSSSPSKSPSTGQSSTETPSSSPNSSPSPISTVLPTKSRSNIPSDSPVKPTTKTPSTMPFNPVAQLWYNGRLSFVGMECSSSPADINLGAQDLAHSILAIMCSRVNCGSNDKVIVTNICGQDSYVEAARTSLLSRQLASSTEEVYFSFIISAATDSELRAKDKLIGQYLQGSNLDSLMADIQKSIVSSTTAATLRSITAIYYSFVDSFIRGLGLYYPDWGKSETCLNDGNQEDYMDAHPDQWMFASLKDCCNRYFSWDVIGCLGSDPSFVDPTKDLYYPNWGKSNSCINDGKAPAYMKRAPNAWMHASLLDCCKRYYTWEDDFDTCIVSGGGSTPTQSPRTEAWYVQWETFTCVKSCEGPSPCGGLGEKWNILHPSEESCRQQHLWWIK
eukprot:CCRYP_009662-RC/>CCRYP_009662-RC protein AED:0.09 eAED:0.09 QI:0/0.95/0.95/1/0.95/0.95/22/166/2740